MKTRVQQTGSISTAVLRDILAACDDKLTDADLDQAIEEIDEDGSGTVDFEGRVLGSIRHPHVCVLQNSRA
jgi:Ca2+-binding EF-hand superfamily protein